MKETKTYNHPYEPYPIQVEFMNSLYDALDGYKIGIFESPTGTGKTLSLICAGMTWLRDQKRKELQNSLDEVDDSDEPDWVREESREMKLHQLKDRALEFEQRLQEIRKIEERERHLAQDPNHSNKKRRRHTEQQNKNDQEESAFLVDDYISDNEDSSKEINDKGYSREVQQLLDQMGKEVDDAGYPDELQTKTKIFFASRTHSQLTQFVGQLRLTKFPSSLDDSLEEQVKEIPLSSRQQLCIHKKVSQYSSVTQKNDACLDMQKKDSTKCEFMLNINKSSDRVKSNDFRDSALAQIRDIEDLAELGREMKVCPYYESRRALSVSEVVALPYQLLIQRSARNALGVNLKDSVIIIDEAHNIMDTISSLFSMSISVTDVSRAKRGVQVYSDKFRKRLNGANQIYLAQMMKALGSLEKFLLDVLDEKNPKKTTPGTEVDQESILKDGGGNLINIYKLEKYLEKSKLAFKIETYLETLDGEEESTQKLVLSKVIAFLLAITNPSSEGKVFYGKSPQGKLQLQYLLLDPSAHFREIVEDARCVILAGGTMEPVGDYFKYLFPYVDRSMVKVFSCGHVIPDENLTVCSLASGPAKREFSFTFANRESQAMIDQLGKTLFNLSAIVPAGMVVFFPSYQYLNDLITEWTKSKILDRIGQRKKVFMEPRDGSVDSVLLEYKACISRCQANSADNDSAGSGAILFSVVGGKMSEGINFSDDLARAVVMIGLPFPNLMSAEMVAKREYIESQVNASGGSRREALDATKDFYENICMRAVNQSIGRAIRHANDYAAIVMIDSRYGTSRIKNKLPNWIQTRLDHKSQNTFPEAVRTLGMFFKNKRK